MGNSSSTQYEQFHQYYVKHGENKDPRYGHVVYYHHRNQPKDLVLVKDKWTNSLAESQDINTFVQNRQSIDHPNLAPCRNYIMEEDKQWCSTFYKHNLAFDYYDNNLEKEIRKRNSDSDFSNFKSFSEPELWYLANSVTNVDLALAREGGGYHGDVQPSTVLLDEEGKVKMIDSGLLHLNKSTYQRMLYDRNVKAAVSPQLLEQLQQKKVNPEYDASKEESWGVGMVALCAATNTTLDDYYDWSVPELRRHVLNEKLDSINGPYSKQFHGFVESSLEESEDRRATLEDHERFLRPHQNDINNLKLDFKLRKTNVANATPVIVQEVRTDNYTGLVYGDDAFFRNPTPTQIVREIQPVTVNPVIQLNYDDFFGQKTTIVENDRGDFFFR
jgi:hypothetical protein